MVQEPAVEFRNVPLKNRSVPVVAGEVGIDSWNRSCQPLTVTEGDEPVLPSVPELHRHADRVHLETPGTQLGDAVVPPPLAAGGETGAEAVNQEFGHRRRSRELIRFHREHGFSFRPEIGPRGGFVLEHAPRVVDVRLLHAGEVIESGRSVWGR